MKKLFTFISVILLITSYGEEFQKKNDLIKLKLNGRVRSLDYSVYSAVEKLGNLEKDKQIYNNREILLRPNSANQMDSWVDWYLIEGNK